MVKNYHYSYIYKQVSKITLAPILRILYTIQVPSQHVAKANPYLNSTLYHFTPSPFPPSRIPIGAVTDVTYAKPPYERLHWTPNYSDKAFRCNISPTKLPQFDAIPPWLITQHRGQYPLIHSTISTLRSRQSTTYTHSPIGIVVGITAFKISHLILSFTYLPQHRWPLSA